MAFICRRPEALAFSTRTRFINFYLILLNNSIIWNQDKDENTFSYHSTNPVVATQSAFWLLHCWMIWIKENIICILILFIQGRLPCNRSYFYSGPSTKDIHFNMLYVLSKINYYIKNHCLIFHFYLGYTFCDEVALPIGSD